MANGRSTWAPFQLAITLALVGYVIIWTTPETSQIKGFSYSPLTNLDPDLSLDCDMSQSPSGTDTAPPADPQISPLPTTPSLTSAFHLFLLPQPLPLPPRILTKENRLPVRQLLVQYAPERFHLPLRATA